MPFRVPLPLRSSEKGGGGMNDIERLTKAIPVGRRNAIHVRNLADNLGVSERTLRIMINGARDKGELICTGDEGIWLPESEADVRESYGRQRSMALSILKSATGSRRFLRAAEKTPGLTVATWNQKRREEKLNDHETGGKK